MKQLTQTGVGTADSLAAVRDSKGKSLLPLQADVTGTASFRVLGRVAPDARWQEVRAPNSADFLETVSWCPYLRLEILSGTGTVTLWIGEE